MSARPYALSLLLAGVAAAVVAWNSFASVLVGLFSVALLVGFYLKRVMPTLLAGLLLYAPLAAALAIRVPQLWSYLLAGLFILSVCERLTFEYEIGEVRSSPTGIDVEAESKVAKVSRQHAKDLGLFVSLAAAVLVGSLAASYLTVYASELIAAGMLLMLALVIYARR